MGTRLLRMVLLITASPILFGSSCNKDSSRPCRYATYSFNVTSEFSPQKEIYNIGDTIFLISSIPKLLLNLISNQHVDYSNSVGIGGDIGIALPDSLSRENKPAKDSFEYVSITGKFVTRPINQNQGINNEYFESMNYSFRGGIICKKKGVYAISVDNLISPGLRGVNCTNASFNMIVTNSNKQINLYQSILGITLDQYSIEKIYCFRVQ